MPDQTAERIVRILRDKVFMLVGPPHKLQSDQGHDFESRIIADFSKAFAVKKFNTTIPIIRWEMASSKAFIAETDSDPYGEEQSVGGALTTLTVHVQNQQAHHHWIISLRDYLWLLSTITLAT